MDLKTSAIALLATLCLSGAASAQQTEIDAQKLPVDIERLQRKFRESTEREQRSGPTLRYTVDVFAKTPRIQLITPEDNVRFGPTRNTAPTHQDMINIVTPQAFRSPVMDFSNLMRWINDKTKDKK